MRRCARAARRARVIVLTSFLDDDKVLPAVRAGAAGYLLKDVQPADLVSAIRTVDGGDALLHPAVAARVLRELTADGSRRSAADSLTSREHEVLALIARGRANKAIALDLACAEKTSRPTSATSSPSSVCRTARRRRCTRCARAWRDRA